MQEVVTVEFASRPGDMGQVIVSPFGELVDDRETGPAKLLVLVRETCIGPSLPKLMFAGVRLIVKSPTCMIDLAS